MGVFESLLLALLLAAVGVVDCEQYKLGVLLPYDHVLPGQNEGELFNANMYGAAVTLAVNRVNKDSTILPNTRLSFVWNNTECNRTKMVEQQQWQLKQGVIAFIGPSCHARKAVRVAKKRGLAVISYGSQDPHLSNKQEYPNFARANPSNYQSVWTVLEILRSNGWKEVTIVLQDHSSWRTYHRYLVLRLQEHGINVRTTVKLAPLYMPVPPGDDVVMQAKNNGSHATIFLCDYSSMLEILTQLETYGMLENDTSYGFIAFNFHRSSVNNCIKYPFKWFFSTFDGFARSRATKRAFSRLLVVALKPDGEDTNLYAAFKKQLKKRTSEKPFYSSVYQGCLFYKERCLFNRSTSKPPYTGAYLYNAVVQLSTALHQLKVDGVKPTGTNVVNKLKGKAFVGIDGHRCEFDHNAELKSEYAVLGIRKIRSTRRINRFNMLPLIRKYWTINRNDS